MSKSSQTAGPLALLTPCSNSHPFEERRIPVPVGEDQAIKIGRAVARIQSAPNNAIFDCKVLSRNHAVLWYGAEESEFFIRDVKSSNGTFINNERLSNSGEESAPRPLRSGDILQLGVEIIDNAKKVASGCITCIARLYNERGEECVEQSAGVGHAVGPILMRSEHIPMKYTLVRNDKLFIMDQYIKEARFREGMLGQKLAQLEEQLETAQEALKTSWQALINEEQLLSRIEILESQLTLLSSKNHPTQDGLRKEIQSIHEDRAKAELTAKDTLRKAEEQLFETNCRLSEAENGLVNLEKDNDALRTRCADFERALVRERGDHEELLIKYNDLLFNYNALEKSARAMATAAAAAAAAAAAKKSSGGDASQRVSFEREISVTAEEGGTEFRVTRVGDNGPSAEDGVVGLHELGPSSPVNYDEFDIPPEPPYVAAREDDRICGIRSRLLELVNSPQSQAGNEAESEAALIASVRRLLEGVNAFDGGMRQLRDSTTPCRSHPFGKSPDGRMADGQVLLLSTFPLLLFILILLFPLMRVSDVLSSPAAQQSTDETLEASVTGESQSESHSEAS